MPESTESTESTELYTIHKDGMTWARTLTREVAETEAERLFNLGYASAVVAPDGSILIEFEQ